jgi:hypothetical protein
MSEKKNKVPTYADKFGYGKTPRKRQFATNASGDQTSKDVDFVLPKPDAQKVQGQEFWVLSCCAPEKTRVRSKNICIKNSGCFPTLELAEAQAKKIRDEDPRFNVDVVSMYEWGSVPISEELKPLIKKNYTDVYMTRVMKGLQQSMSQSKKEMDERIKRDRDRAEQEMRKKHGPDYVMPSSKPDSVKKYEEVIVERDEKVDEMQFGQRELMESFASFMSVNQGKIEPKAAGEFMRFLEAKKMAEKVIQEKRLAGEEVGEVSVSVPEAPAPTPSEAPAEIKQ